MLAPKRVKHRKTHKGRMRGNAHRGNKVSFGEFGLQATECGWISNRQIEAARVAMTRHMKRGGKVKTIPYVKNYSIDYFSRWKVTPEMMSTKMVG